MSDPTLIIGRPVRTLADEANAWINSHTCLVPVDGKQQHTFSARGLWEWLEQPWGEFKGWWKDAIRRQSLKQEVDFVCREEFLPAKKGRGGHNKKDYLLTTQAAKLVAASDSSPKGRAILRALLDLADRIEAGDPALTAHVNRRHAENHGGELPWHRRISEHIMDHIALMTENHPKGFTVLMASYPYIAAMELALVAHFLPTCSSDMADGSIGLCWSNYRYSVLGRRRLPALESAKVYLPRKGWTPVIVYPECELVEFNHWLREVYIPEKMPNYFREKFRGGLKFMAPLSAAEMCCRRMTHKAAMLTIRERETLTAAGGIIKALPA